MNFEEVKSKLEKRGYKVSCFETGEACRDYLNTQIDGVSVGIGGSMTAVALELQPTLREHNTVYCHNSEEQCAVFGKKAIRDLAVNTEIYISSVNGMSADGIIINIDGCGNRIASTCYGHKKLYLLVGKNKIAPDFEAALWRARNVASPKNAQRLGLKTPCAVKADRCYDCSSPDRICNGFLVFDRAMFGMETEVLLINEDLGY